MDWGTLLAALLGGLIGALISAAMTGFGWRRETKQGRRARQWEDAHMVADIRQFLDEIGPLRRSASVSISNPDVDAERTRWVRLQQRGEDAQRLLLVIAAGHPSEAVQSSARKLAFELIFATLVTKLYVGDVLRRQITADIQDQAFEAHKTALATADELEQAVKEAAT